MKKITYQQEAREKLLIGVNKIALAVGTTLGPRGRNVGLDQGYQKIVVHDGVTVANNFFLKDEFEEFGASMVRQAAQNQVETVGDGTTLVTILTQALVEECMQRVSAGINPMQLQKGLEEASKMLQDKLRKMAKPVNTLEDKIHVATIASNNKELGELIGGIIHRVGQDGVVTVEESKSTENVVEFQEGMQFENGWMSPYQMTDITRMESTIENPYIVICDKEISNIMELLPFGERLLKVTKNVVFIAPSYSNEILTSLVMTKIKGQANILSVRAPLFGEKQKDFLRDIAVLTGGRVVGDELGSTFDQLEVKVCGRADRITATKEATLIVGGKGNKADVADHITSIKKLMETETGFNKEKLEERVAKLSKGIAVVRVGGSTEVEMRDKREWATDAVASTKVAIEDGIVPGGEIPLLSLSTLEDKNFPDITTAQIMKRVLCAPFKKLIENAGMDYTETVIKLQGATSNFGVDVTDGKVKDLEKAGIIDPVKVLISAIDHAVSVSVKIITTDALICEEIQKPKNEVN